MNMFLRVQCHDVSGAVTKFDLAIVPTMPLPLAKFCGADMERHELAKESSP